MKMAALAKDIYSVASKVGLSRFMPGPMQLAQNLYQIYSTANNIQKAMETFQKQVTDMVQKAAQQANLPTESFDKMAEQIQQAFKNAGSSAENMFKSEAPSY